MPNKFAMHQYNKLEFDELVDRRNQQPTTTVIASQSATSRAKSRRFAAVALETRLRAQWRGNLLYRWRIAS